MGKVVPYVRPAQPDLAWLAHPALTGLSAGEWDALIPVLMTLHDQQREAGLDKRRCHRLGLPQTIVAALVSVRPETTNRRIREIRQLLEQAGHAIRPGPYRLACLDDLYGLATAEGITVASEIRTAC